MAWHQSGVTDADAADAARLFPPFENRLIDRYVRITDNSFLYAYV